VTIQSLTDANWKRTAFVLGLAVVLYFPFLFLGYGSDADSYSVIRTAQTLLSEHRYVVSRPPGYFLHEAATMVLFVLSGHFLTNLASMVMSLVIIALFLRLCRRNEVPNAELLAVFIIIHPLYWVASTSTIDYLWALALLMVGYELFRRARHLAAGIIFGLAIGARISSVLFVGSLVLARLLTGKKKLRGLFPLVGACAVTGGLLYVPAFIQAGYSLSFLTYWAYEWTFVEHAARFVHKNIYFWGFQTTLVALLLVPTLARGFARQRKEVPKELLVFSGLVILSHEILFFHIPIEKSYLLPILPFVMLLVGIALKGRRALLVLLLVVELSYNFVDMGVVKPDVPNYATGARFGFWIEPGYMFADIKERKRRWRVYVEQRSRLKGGAGGHEADADGER